MFNIAVHHNLKENSPPDIINLFRVSSNKNTTVSVRVLTHDWVRTMIFSVNFFIRSSRPGISDWTGTLVCVILNAA